MSLQISNLTKNFGNIAVLNSISIEIKDGEFTAILGPSGCGKTTLLKIIAGFINPSSGTVKMGDSLYSSPNFNLPAEKRNLGMVFQSFALWPHMNVIEHVKFPLNNKENRKMSIEEKDAAIEKALSCTGLSAFANRLPEELSGGQKQRLALARAIVSKPDILLMDEPLSSLDAELKISMRKEIQKIHKLTRATIIYVTHDQSEALAMADKIIIMKDGNIEQTGTPLEIYKRPKTEFVSTFVSKCNLIKGIWEQNIFKINNTEVIYKNDDIDPFFIKNNIYPVRPEQFEIQKKGNGINGVIANKQYNGREIHYTVNCNDDSYTVYSDADTEFNIDDKIVLIKKEILN